LGWPQSKVSKLETGKQTPTAADMDAWATATGRPDAAAELKGRLLGLETTYRSWKRQLAGGHRAVQEANIIQEQQAQLIRLFEPAIIPGIFQTSEYARNVLTDVSERLGSPRDIEAGVRARMKRQDTLYQPNHHFHALVWEAALLTVRCSAWGMIAQLERRGGPRADGPQARPRLRHRGAAPYSRAAAHIAMGTPDGALEALVPVLSLPPEQRLDTVTRRLQNLAAMVARSQLACAPAARDLHGAVEVYCRESAPRIALSPTSPGTALITG